MTGPPERKRDREVILLGIEEVVEGAGCGNALECFTFGNVQESAQVVRREVRRIGNPMLQTASCLFNFIIVLFFFS